MYLTREQGFGRCTLCQQLRRYRWLVYSWLACPQEQISPQQQNRGAKHALSHMSLAFRSAMSRATPL